MGYRKSPAAFLDPLQSVLFGCGVGMVMEILMAKTVVMMRTMTVAVALDRALGLVSACTRGRACNSNSP